MKVLVTADRHYKDEFIVATVLSGFYQAAIDVYEDLTIIEGGGRGGDEMARKWGRNLEGVEHITVEAEWMKYGKPAGPIRNRKMFDEHEPDVVIAFHDDLERSKGTRDMVDYAKSQGAAVYVISHHELG